MQYNCNDCLHFDVCGGECACEHFCLATENENTYMEMMSNIYNEYRKDYLEYLKEFNR